MDLGNVISLQKAVRPTDFQSWVMMMQVWGYHESYLKMTQPEQRVYAHVMVLDCLNTMKDIRVELDKLLKYHKVQVRLDSGIVRSLNAIEFVIQHIYENYTSLFNNIEKVNPLLNEN